MTNDFLKSRTPEQLETIISRHRDAGQMDNPLCVQAMAELSTRTVKGFNLRLAIAHLVDAAKTETPTDFKQTAIASGVFDPETQKWGQWVQNALNLDRMCIYCRSHDLPQLTAMLGNAGSKTSDTVTIGFLKGLKAAGVEYDGEPRAVYEEHRLACIEWAKSSGPDEAL
ncbi:hypothetical protein J7443_21825 [Tropicibacter sp. R15_0]|uniref:hypothetical protein n=1 Tax=Tropicibacter sp. R15_0 TaxID=2821101 RepID=UPI001ADB05FF|nr:hypothetical protein [Tropicibacter sp. R15_0]MBO9467885.1 hypothetical protein [Tropicibacter sp. R15_0]